MAEKQRDDALSTVKQLSDRVDQLKMTNFKAGELRTMPIQKLKTLQVRLTQEIYLFSRYLCIYIYFVLVKIAR